jgi:hypothetical protein
VTKKRSTPVRNISADKRKSGYVSVFFRKILARAGKIVYKVTEVNQLRFRMPIAAVSASDFRHGICNAAVTGQPCQQPLGVSGKSEEKSINMATIIIYERFMWSHNQVRASFTPSPRCLPEDSKYQVEQPM